MIDSNTQPIIHERIFAQIQFALNIVQSLQRRLIFETENGDFLSETPKDLAQLLQDLSKVLENHLLWEYLPKAIELQERIPELKAEEFEDEFRRLRIRVIQAARMAAHMTEYVKFVNGSTVYVTPWRLTGQLERLTRLISPRSRLVISPRWKFNYSFTSISGDLTKITRTVDTKEGTTQTGAGLEIDLSLKNAFSHVLSSHPYFFCLSFPPNASDDILNMAIWFHEMGHLAGRKRISDFFQTDQHITDGMEFAQKDSLKPYYDKLFNFSRVDPTQFIDKTDFENEMALQVQFTYSRWSKEIIADMVAIQMGGPAALFALIQFLSCIEPDEKLYKKDENYPPFPVRAWVLLITYEHWFEKNHDWYDKLPKDVQDAYTREMESIQQLASRINQDYQENTLDHLKSDLGLLIEMRIMEEAREYYDKFEQEVSNIGKVGDFFIGSKDFLELPSMLQDLENGIPPRFIGMDEYSQLDYFAHGKSLPVLLNAGWLYWLNSREETSETGIKAYSERSLKYQGLNQLIAKALEIVEARRWFYEHGHKLPSPPNQLDTNQKNGNSLPTTKPEALQLHKGGPLSKDELTRRLLKDFEILPLLDWKEQVDNSSIDIRLGNEFIITKLPVITKLDPADLGIGSSTEQFQSKIYVPFGQPFVLHPGQFVLGSTLEYMHFPDDLMGLVLGRSSWGRLGLVIATASKIDPGFFGCVTLELTNLGNVPFFLYPGSRIGQIVVYQLI